jgi:glutamate-ammonia-ligase adenylyltransferase
MSQLIDPARVSRFAARRLAARPALAAELSGAAFTRAEMDAALQGAAGEPREDEDAFKRRLRQLRERVVLREMARDLSGRAPLEEVCEAISDLAEATIAAALAWLEIPDLIVVGMGKLGGRELNVSSDVDLVFLHPDPQRAEALEKPARRLIRLLSETTEDGFVFRVDMRLRPF